MTKKPLAYGLAAGLAATLSLAPTAAFAASADASSADAATPASAATASTQNSVQARIDALLAKSSLSPELKARIHAAAATLPANWATTVAAKQKQYGLTGTTFYEQSQSLINPDDYQCQSTSLRDWLTAEMSDVDFINLLLLSLLGGDQIPTYDALLFGQQSKANTFGIDGSYTNELNREMTNLKRFWDFDGSDIQLIPMHGKVYQDLDRITHVYEVLYGMDHATALSYAELVQDIVLSDPGMAGGENPYFTFNAFAFDPTPEDAAEFNLTKRIIVGDGILQGTRGIGLGDKAAPLGILAHEYGHQVQYAKNLFDSPFTGPEATRRIELMADAFGTYFVVHARGSSLNAQRTLDVQKSFYNVGDCSFGSNGHHGTPNQRLKSSQFAVNLIEDAPNQGHKLPALVFDARFEKALPSIVAPDAS
ncbi:MAG TPA: hypothetical protein VFL99_15545 [Segeticoccus sp.]|uniref:hypothetical protein n=1 Tax=Segeticoccus sp. TaxID=2706531 RepID=UPI002D7E3CEE|nr:hypothetical protein [Segeticoccus sp.]HET8601741.1 hypothetical protein [Segeticoccus sp.]